MAVAIPWIVAGVAALGSAAKAKAAGQAGAFNATQRQMEGQAALDQATQQEAQTRSADREILGKQAAAIGAAGIGYGGSSKGVMQQSAVNAELDALNVRYRGLFTNAGYKTEANLARWEGDTNKKAYYLQAGGQILSGASSAYGASKGLG
jgi:hypothetical protein